ncbi:DoxX family protein [Anaerobacillus sp. MEB173]|uniref:DoxX family protein n=1 Tax=Anaerobacillus sp. MEB173 TaxID=3383345 RepID=UPI003F926C07
MFGEFLRYHKWAAWILTFLRFWLGWKWLTSGWGKVVGDFNATGYLNNAVANPVTSHGEVVYPNYVIFLERFALPNADLFSLLVAWGELLVGIGLILGALTTLAAFFGVVMNFAFLFAGTISTNPLMILVAMFILVAGANAGKLGLDRWIIPYVRIKLRE